MRSVGLDPDDHTTLAKTARAADERLELYMSCAFDFYFLLEPGDPSLTPADIRSPSELLALGFDQRFLISAFVSSDADPIEIGQISQLSRAAPATARAALAAIESEEQ